MIFLGTKDELHERLEKGLVKWVKYPVKDGIMHQLNTVVNPKPLTMEDLQRAMIEISRQPFYQYVDSFNFNNTVRADDYEESVQEFAPSPVYPTLVANEETINRLSEELYNWTTYATTGTIISDRSYVTATSASQARYTDSDITIV